MSFTKDINTAPTPFVNHLNIEQYVGQHVSVHGKCAGIKNGILTLIVQTEPKNEEIMVTNCYVDIPVNSNVKILGNVASDKSVTFESYIKLQDDFDLNVVNEIIPILNHKEVAPMCF